MPDFGKPPWANMMRARRRFLTRQFRRQRTKLIAIASARDIIALYAHTPMAPR